MKHIKAGFNKVVELDKKLIAKVQKKFGLSDYQVACLRLAKGIVIGAVLL